MNSYLPTDLEPLPHTRRCGGGGCVPHCFVAEHVGGELGLGLGDAGPGGAVVAVDLPTRLLLQRSDCIMEEMYLCQHEEVSQGADDPAGGDQDDDESDEVVPARGSGASPTPASERRDGHYQSTENEISYDMILYMISLYPYHPPICLIPRAMRTE